MAAMFAWHPLRVESVVVPVRATSEIERAFESITRAPDGGLILTTDPFTYPRQQLIAELASRHRLPAISWVPDFPKNGGLMCYGAAINLLDQFQQAAGYVSMGTFHGAPLSTRRLISLDVRSFEDRPPFFDLGLLLCGKRFRRLLLARRNVLALIGKSLPHNCVS